MSERRKPKRARRERREKQARRRRTGLILVLILLAVGATVAAGVAIALVGTGGGGGGGASSGGDTGVFLLHSDDTREAVFNGAHLDVGGMTAEVFFSDFPPKLNSGMDVYLTDKASGAPVQDAQVTVLPSMPMPAMRKGFIQIKGLPRQPGHYFVSWQLPMSAAWTLSIEIERGGQKAVVDLLAFMG